MRSWSKPDRIHVKPDRMYKGDKVMEWLNILRKRLSQERTLRYKSLKTNVNMRTKNMNRMKKHINRASIYRLKHTMLMKKYKKMMATWRQRLRDEKVKYKKFRRDDLQLMRQQETQKLKYCWVTPNDKTNPRHYDLITWARLYTKIELARQRTELKNFEIMLLIWISAHKEGDAKSRMFMDDLNFKRSKLTRYSKRLIEFSLVTSRKEKGQVVLELTERGRNFVKPIIEFVKKEHQHAKKRKRKFIRNRVSAAKAASRIHDGESQVQP